MSYSVQNIRNVCLLGHGGNGKTSLAESMLYTARYLPKEKLLEKQKEVKSGCAR